MTEHSSLRLPFLRQRTWVALRALELRSYLADAMPKRNPDARHVLIYAQGRSGTTLLESLLCSTGHFTGRGEALNTLTREVMAPVSYVRGLGRMAGDGNIVVHVKGSHLGRDRRRPVEPAPFLQALHDDGWTIVNIRRRNIVDQVLSECLARARGAYHKTDDAEERARLRIEPEDFLMRYDRRLRFHADDETVLGTVPHIRLYYEDDLADARTHQATADRVVRAVGLDPRPVRTTLRKINTPSRSDVFLNLDELRSAALGRGIAWESDSAPSKTSAAP